MFPFYFYLKNNQLSVHKVLVVLIIRRPKITFCFNSCEFNMCEGVFGLQALCCYVCHYIMKLVCTHSYTKQTCLKSSDGKTLQDKKPVN